MVEDAKVLLATNTSATVPEDTTGKHVSTLIHVPPIHARTEENAKIFQNRISYVNVYQDSQVCFTLVYTSNFLDLDSIFTLRINSLYSFFYTFYLLYIYACQEIMDGVK